VVELGPRRGHERPVRRVPAGSVHEGPREPREHDGPRRSATLAFPLRPAAARSCTWWRPR